MYCFPADTLILTSLTSSRPIADLRPGDVVLAFDPAAGLGRGALVPRRVARIWRNTTTEWVRLRWAENGEARELVATPGHHFLDVTGGFPALAEMIRDGRASVVLASGEVAEVSAERIVWSQETAHARILSRRAPRWSAWSRTPAAMPKPPGSSISTDWAAPPRSTPTATASPNTRCPKNPAAKLESFLYKGFDAKSLAAGIGGSIGGPERRVRRPGRRVLERRPCGVARVRAVRGAVRRPRGASRRVKPLAA